MDSDIPIDVLDDLCSRFIINVPEEERNNVIRICFQIELAHWFYIDFYSKQKENRRICNLKEFALIVFNHVPFLHPFVEKFDQIIDEWKEYKYSVPTYGAILLNEELTHALLVQSFGSKSSWGFPKGKINKGESAWQCAIREVMEETGFDIREYMDPTEYVEAIINDQTVRLYIVPGISMDQQFVPKTRNEIKSVNWFPLADLPATRKEATTKLKTMSGTMSLFMVTPFVRKLREWIYENYGRAPKKTKSKRPRNKSCGDIENLELKDYMNTAAEKKKVGKKPEKALGENVYEAYLPVGSSASQQFSSDRLGVSGSNMASEADVKVRRTLEYVISQNPQMGSPSVQNPGEDQISNKKTPPKIRILKKPDNRTPSGKDLLSTLFSNKELVSGDSTLPKGVPKVPDSAKRRSPKPHDIPPAVKNDLTFQQKISESPQSKSFGNINHDRAHSSFARVSNKGGNRNYFLSQSPAIDTQNKQQHPKPASGSQKKTSEGSKGMKTVKFVPISFSKSFSKVGIKSWSNFKFDRQDIMKRMNG